MSAAAITNLDIGISHTISYKMHPSVIVNILDVYHRNTNKDFILGVLLGKIFPDYVLITNVVFVPWGYTQTGEIGIDNDLLNKLLRYKSKIFFGETRVGWFITKKTIDSTVAVLHKHLLPNLKSQTASWAGPVILLVDPSLEKEKIELSGYVSQQNKLFRECFAYFNPVKITVELFGEKLGTAQLLYGNTSASRTYESSEKMAIFKNSFEIAKEKIQILQKTISEISGEEMKQYPDLVKEIKSLLSERFSIVNESNQQAIDRFVEDNHHLRYLNDLAHLQLILTEKLNNKVTAVAN